MAIQLNIDKYTYNLFKSVNPESVFFVIFRRFSLTISCRVFFKNKFFRVVFAFCFEAIFPHGLVELLKLCVVEASESVNGIQTAGLRFGFCRFLFSQLRYSH